MDTAGELQKQPRLVAGLLSGMRSSEFSTPVGHGSSEVGSHPSRSLHSRAMCCHGDLPGSRSKPSIPKWSLAVCQSWAPWCDNAAQNGLIPFHWPFDRYFDSSPEAALSVRRRWCMKQSSLCDNSHGEQGGPACVPLQTHSAKVKDEQNHPAKCKQSSGPCMCLEEERLPLATGKQPGHVSAAGVPAVLSWRTVCK